MRAYQRQSYEETTEKEQARLMFQPVDKRFHDFSILRICISH
jgi:hypothetical protein